MGTKWAQFLPTPKTQGGKTLKTLDSIVRPSGVEPETFSFGG